MSPIMRRVEAAWLASLAFGCAPPMPASDPYPELNRVAAPMTATSLDGASLELPERGHVTVVELWATWCEPCRASLPDVERVWQSGRGAGLRVIGVATDDNPGLVTNTVRRSDVTYPNVVDASGEVRGWLLVRDLPTVVVFDRRGRVRWVHTGPSDDGGTKMGDVVASLERESP